MLLDYRGSCAPGSSALGRCLDARERCRAARRWSWTALDRLVSSWIVSDRLGSSWTARNNHRTGPERPRILLDTSCGLWRSWEVGNFLVSPQLGAVSTGRFTWTQYQSIRQSSTHVKHNVGSQLAHAPASASSLTTPACTATVGSQAPLCPR